MISILKLWLPVTTAPCEKLRRPVDTLKLQSAPSAPKMPVRADCVAVLKKNPKDDEVTVYTYGEHLFDAMLQAIDAAEDHVYFETYIWKADVTGRAFVDALNRAAARGVRAR